MRQEKEIEELIENSLGASSDSGSMFSNLSERQPVDKGEKPKATKAKRAKKLNPTIDQMKAVRASQNEARGVKGKPKGARTLVGFHAPDDIIARIEELTFITGKSKNVLYNEALDLLLRKYKNA